MRDIHLNNRLDRIMAGRNWFYDPTQYEIYLNRARELRGRVLGELARSALEVLRCRVLVPLLRRHRRAAAIRTLMELSDRQLADIGLTRGQIPEAVGRSLLVSPAAPCVQTVRAAEEKAAPVEVKKAA